MVDFVEEGTSERAFGFNSDGGSVFEEGFDFDLFRARNEAVDFGDREAAFVVTFEFSFGFNDFWVD